MASSGKRRSGTDGSSTARLDEAVAACLQGVVAPGARLTIGLSGGIDSVVLLDVLARLAPRLSLRLDALHINHRLSSHAAGWARFCRSACRARDIACRVSSVAVARGNSTERAAREARYAVFRRVGTDFIVLAHNADDQAETVLLQLLRGAGVRGLAAMPFLSAGAPGTPRILRPLLAIPRGRIERHAREFALAWIEDESNADTVYRRNWLRHEVLPLLAARVPAYRAALTRAARHCAEAVALLDDLGRLDAAGDCAGARIPLARLRALTPTRAKNLLRFVMARQGWLMPHADRLDEAVRQALTARADARVRVDLGCCELRRYRGYVELADTTTAGGEAPVKVWQGERRLALPALGGQLTMVSRRGSGLSLARLADHTVTIRGRAGGERLQPDAGRPRRTVKNLLQEAGVPPWRRSQLPFIYCGDELACVAGVAIDHRFRAAPGERGVVPVWKVLGLRP